MTVAAYVWPLTVTYIGPDSLRLAPVDEYAESRAFVGSATKMVVPSLFCPIIQ